MNGADQPRLVDATGTPSDQPTDAVWGDVVAGLADHSGSVRRSASGGLPTTALLGRARQLPTEHPDPPRHHLSAVLLGERVQPWLLELPVRFTRWARPLAHS